MNKSRTTCAQPFSGIFLPLLALLLPLLSASAQTGPVYWMPDTAADPRLKDFHLPVYVALPAGNPGCNPDSLTIEIEFNATRFFPRSVTRGTIVSNTVAGENRILGISLAGTAPVANGKLTEIVGDVLIGNSESTPFAFRSVLCNGVQVTDSLFDGFFRMAGNYCEEGSDRLLEYRSGFGIKRITPNPAGGPVKIEILGVEMALTRLEVYSSFGHRVFATAWTPSTVSELEREVILPPDMPGGVYEVVLRSPGRHDVQSLIIAR